MATGPTGPVKDVAFYEKEMEEMIFEGSKLAFELNRADGHIEKLEHEIKNLKDGIENLQGELGVALAERNQADEKVLEQDEEIKQLKETITTLNGEKADLLDAIKDKDSKLQEWVDFEGWRQGRWVLVQDELKRLREEVASLKKKLEPGVVDS